MKHLYEHLGVAPEVFERLSSIFKLGLFRKKLNWSQMFRILGHFFFHTMIQVT